MPLSGSVPAAVDTAARDCRIRLSPSAREQATGSGRALHRDTVTTAKGGAGDRESVTVTQGLSFVLLVLQRRPLVLLSSAGNSNLIQLN